MAEFGPLLPKFSLSLPKANETRLATLRDGDSFSRFKTVAFDPHVMRQSFRWIPLYGTLYCGDWLDAIVPRCYKDQVRELVVKVARRGFLGRKWLGDQTLHEFVLELRTEIWAKLEPIDPGDI